MFLSFFREFSGPCGWHYCQQHLSELAQQIPQFFRENFHDVTCETCLSPCFTTKAHRAMASLWPDSTCVAVRWSDLKNFSNVDFFVFVSYSRNHSKWYFCFVFQHFRFFWVQFPAQHLNFVGQVRVLRGWLDGMPASPEDSDPMAGCPKEITNEPLGPMPASDFGG